jgi:hypothetical protein
VHFGNPRHRSEHDIFDARLRRCSHGDGVPITPSPAVIQRMSISGIGCEACASKKKVFPKV